ncbi:MAG TPA: hypothetical protein VHX38_27060 [Pseudonocardiaceae bacterium]|jgi:hypothetical protein|nr:hypothetical protein [Pseudonocardiaceae bacterium]
MSAEDPTPPLASVTPNFVARGGRDLSALEWIDLAATLIHLALDGHGDPADAHQWLNTLTDTIHTAFTQGQPR